MTTITQLPTPTLASAPPPFYDVNGDNHVSPIDVLLIVNRLNSPSGGEGEDEFDNDRGIVAPNASGIVFGPLQLPGRKPEFRFDQLRDTISQPFEEFDANWQLEARVMEDLKIESVARRVDLEDAMERNSDQDYIDEFFADYGGGQGSCGASCCHYDSSEVPVRGS